MFNWPLFFILVIISLPGLLISVPRLITSIQNRMGPNFGSDRPAPPYPVLVAAATLQSLVLVALASGIGTALGPRVGFSAPLLDGLVTGAIPFDHLTYMIFPTLIIGGGGAFIFIGLYYLVFRPRLDEQTRRTTEELRMALGLWGRILYGGVVEEILIRWGLMTLLTWILGLVFGPPTATLIWIAILISGLLFGLGHLPSSLAAGARMSGAFLAASLGLNLWASVIFGWLFWQYGLLAAITAHILFHLIWLPFELRYSRLEMQTQVV